MREERSMYGIDGRPSNFIWRNWNFITSFLGMTCTVGVWGMAVTVVDDEKNIGIYLIFCGIITAFLEISFVLDKLFNGYCSEKSCSQRCWRAVLAMDNWKRGLLYLIFSIPCYLIPKGGWKVLVAGALMDFSGLLYFIKTIKAKKHSEPYKYKQLSVT